MRREANRSEPVERAGRRPALVATSLIVLLALMLATACSARRAPSTRFDDATITTKVKAKIAADPEVNPFEVDVDTTRGVVRLSGTVETDADRDEIERIAANTRGVSDVINDIRLGDPSAGDTLNDTVIATKVKSKLTADPDINPFRIDVDVVQGVVTLSGEVDDDRTRNEAEKHARNTRGVQRVENRIELTGDS